jgi:hypothetical protein
MRSSKSRSGLRNEKLAVTALVVAALAVTCDSLAFRARRRETSRCHKRGGMQARSSR